jgi:hypothetical protein
MTLEDLTMTKSIFSPDAPRNDAAAAAAALLRAKAKPSRPPVRPGRPALQPLHLAAGGGAALLLLGFCLSGRWFTERPELVAVHPAQGQLCYQGRPLPAAAILLYPVAGKSGDAPRPHAICKADGSFVLGTYSDDDGAPAGDYQVTVQWFEKLDATAGDRNARNLLPARYARPDASGLVVRIGAGANHLPPLHLFE